MTTTSDISSRWEDPLWGPLSKYGFSAYEASDYGEVRSIDRVAPDGRRLRGRVLKPRIPSNGYPTVNLTDDTGVVRTRTVHSLVMLAHVGECPDGQQVRHLDDNPLNNRWAPGATDDEVRANGGNLVYGTPPENAEDKFRNGAPRAAPKPERRCVRCDAVLETNGRRCHACVVQIGVLAADMLRDGVPLKLACQELDYPSEDGLHTLAVTHGGYGQQPDPWLRSVTRRLATLRTRFWGRDAQ